MPASTPTASKRLGRGQRGFLYAGFIAAPVLVLVVAVGSEWSTTRGLIGFIVAMTFIPWVLIGLAAMAFGGRDDGLAALICGVAAVLFAVSAAWYGLIVASYTDLSDVL